MATTVQNTGGAVVGAPRPEIDDASRKQVIDQLQKAGFSGEVISPTDSGYAKARTVWNAMVDKRPGLVVKPKTRDDVVAVVKAARAHGLRPSIRCGGHNVAGKGLSDGGLTIDMTNMKAVVVEDLKLRIVSVEGGCQLGDVDAETAKHGLIVPAGIMSETGVGGLALGGGIGWFSRKHGLTCDNFLALELVTAEGKVVNASATENAELFWALKGGGGNFGVVTKFTFQAHEFGPMMRIGVALHHPENAVEILREYAKIYPSLPNTVGFHAALKDRAPVLPFVPKELVGKRMVMMIIMWLGDANDPAGIEMVEKLNSLGTPAVKAMTVLPFAAGVQKLINEDFEDGHRYYTKEAHCHTLDHQLVDKLVEWWKVMPMDGEVEVIGLGGKICDLSEDATAFSNRGAQMWLNFAMRWDGAENDRPYMEMTRKIVRELEPWLSKGVYVNMLNFDEMDRVVEAFGTEKYQRLGRVKGAYDPDNFFQVNANILPILAGQA